MVTNSNLIEPEVFELLKIKGHRNIAQTYECVGDLETFIREEFPKQSTSIKKQKFTDILFKGLPGRLHYYTDEFDCFHTYVIIEMFREDNKPSPWLSIRFSHKDIIDSFLDRVFSDELTQ